MILNASRLVRCLRDTRSATSHGHLLPCVREEGGLCFICRTNIDINRHPLQNSFNAKSFECQLLKIKLGHGGSTDGVTLMNIYRPPSHSLKDFCDELSDLLSRLGDVIDEDRLVVCGDFNCGGEDSSSIGLDLQNILDIHAMQQFVTTATRLQEAGSGRLLDLVIARAGSTRISQLSVHPTHDISDHHLVTWSLATRMLPPRKLITFFHRNLKGIDKKKFQDDILASAVYSDPADTVDGFTEQLEQTVGDILERHCPLRKRTKFASARRDGHWLSDDAISAKRERRKLERKWKKSGDEQDRIKYRKHCRVTNRKILGARQKFYQDRIEEAGRDPRRRWSVINDVLHATSETKVMSEDECRKMSHVFADYFVDKVRKVKCAITDRVSRLFGVGQDPLYSDRQHTGAVYSDITPPTVDEVRRILNSTPGKSSIVDRIPTSLLKSCSDVFAPLIARLAALSFRDGIFPSRFKVASVTPLLKKPGLDSGEPANYRPISNLNNISKILERLFLRNIIGHVSSSPNFNRYQSAYRRGHSTETALLRLLNDLYRAADAKSRSILILLDLSAAFDTIDSSTLLRRLEFTFGIHGHALDWIGSYLAERSQFVRVGDQQSVSSVVEFGVPQGSVLGPILFSLYISPVANVITSFGVNHIQYADDTQLYISLQDSNSITVLQQCVEAAYDWFGRNGLALNPSKTEALIVGTSARLRHEAPIASVNMAGAGIKIAESVKSLGVTIDCSLNFNKHVDGICRSSGYHIRALRHIRKYIDCDSAKSVACALVGARIDYCNSILHGTSQCNIDKLQRLQNSLARAVVGSGRTEPVTPILARLHWLPIKDRIQYKIALLTHKVLTNNQPEYLADLIHYYQPQRQLRSASHRLLHCPTPRTVFGSRAFCFSAPKVWNSLPHDLIDNQLTLASFKRSLKTFLFHRHFAC